MKNSKFNAKSFFKHAMGVLSTGLAIIVIYLLLWTTGKIDPLSSETIIEFCIVYGLTIYTKIFWYKDTELKVREDETYIENKNTVLDAIDTVTDIDDFDNFIDNLNIQNFNTVINNHCKLLTPLNYKLSLSDKWNLSLMRVFNRKKYKSITDIKLFYFNRYCYKIENKASKVHKLSSSRILTMSRQDLLDDRNFAAHNRNRYIVTGSIISFIIVMALAPLSFVSKEDVDVIATVLKMLTYLLSIFFNIIFTIFNARIETLASDFEYFRKLLNIIDRYNNYKSNPIKCIKISYAKEVDYANTANNSRKEISADSNDIVNRFSES